MTKKIYFMHVAENTSVPLAKLRPRFDTTQRLKIVIN